MMFPKDGGVLAYLRSHIIPMIFQGLAVDASQPLADAVLSLCHSLGWARSPTRLEHFAQFVQEVKAQGQMFTEIHELPEPLPPWQLKTSSAQNWNKKILKWQTCVVLSTGFRDKLMI